MFRIMEDVERARDGSCTEVLPAPDRHDAHRRLHGPPGTRPPRRRAAAFVARGHGVPSWPDAFAAGRLPGLNDPLAYGYHHAERYGIDVTYSRDDPEGPIGRVCRLAARVALGFDIVHAWRNRRLLADVDVIWTHTESQSLGVAALAASGRLGPEGRRPALLLQSVWLIDRWPRLDPLRRWLYRRLLREADILSFHATPAVDRARALFPDAHVELVPFGVSVERRAVGDTSPPALRPAPRPDRPTRVLAVGNDRHRDWATLVDAFGSRPGHELRIVSRTAPRRLIARHPNVSRMRVTGTDELLECFGWADVGIVPLKPNSHASGITALQEFALQRIPAVATDTGGLRGYFDGEAVSYVAARDAEAMRTTVEALMDAPERAAAMANRAAGRMGPEGLSSIAYARRHVELTRELLEDRSPASMTE